MLRVHDREWYHKGIRIIVVDPFEGEYLAYDGDRYLDMFVSLEEATTTIDRGWYDLGEGLYFNIFYGATIIDNVINWGAFSKTMVELDFELANRMVSRLETCVFTRVRATEPIYFGSPWVGEDPSKYLDYELWYHPAGRYELWRNKKFLWSLRTPYENLAKEEFGRLIRFDYDSIGDEFEGFTVDHGVIEDTIPEIYLSEKRSRICDL